MCLGKISVVECMYSASHIFPLKISYVLCVSCGGPGINNVFCVIFVCQE